MITRGVVYDSLLHQVRTTLHDLIGQYLEETYPDAEDQYLDLLAYHYHHGQNLEKKRYYLRRAGEVAQRTYANEAALDYYHKLLPLLEADERIGVLLQAGEVEKLVGQWTSAAEHFGQALSLATATGDKTAVGRSRAAIGELQRMQGDYAGALQSFDDARRVFAESSDREGLAQVLHYSGTVAAQQGDLDVAEVRYQESLKLRRELGDQGGVASLLNNLAIIADYRGRYEESRSLHEEALAIRRSLGDRRSVALSLGNLGHIQDYLGDLAAARNCLEEAVAIQRELGDRWNLANVLNNLGNVVRGQGDVNEARNLYTESLSIYGELSDSWAIAYLLEDIARLAALEDRPADALVLLSAAASLRQAIDAPLPPTEQAALDELQAQLRTASGKEPAEASSQQGRDMSVDQAVEFARRSVTIASISA
jgi:tetratricopeptide (TPR) repeat protein